MEAMIPICALVMVFGVPIVAILTAHQRKMAELIYMNNAHQNNPEVAALRSEIAEIKQLVHQQAIAIDNLASVQGRLNPPSSSDLQERVGNVVR